MMMPSVTICSFLTITNGFKLFDQNVSLTAGEPSKMSEMLALNIYNTFYRTHTVGEGVGQAKAVIFFLIVVLVGLIQLRAIALRRCSSNGKVQEPTQLARVPLVSPRCALNGSCRSSSF